VAVGAQDELTSSTFLGLWVTVKTALDLVKYLAEKCSNHYLLTRRINQDALEISFAASLSLSDSPINKHPFPPSKNLTLLLQPILPPCLYKTSFTAFF